MKKSLGLGLLLGVGLLSSQQAVAEVLTHAGAKVQITVPKGWTQHQDEDVLVIKAPDGGMAVVFAVLPEEHADKALEAIDKAIEKAVGTVTWEHNGEAKEEEINGMATSEWNGSAEDGSIYVDALAISTPADKVLGVYWFTAAAKWEGYEGAVKTIVRGLQPVK